MKFWIVTGGAATGKSAFCRAVLETADPEGIIHFSCDRAAHELWSHAAVINAVSSALGPRFEAAILEGGGIDRRAVREIVFNDPEARLKLEAVLHPSIFQLMDGELLKAQKKGKAKVFLAEVPLYYESRVSLPADSVIVVAASRTVQQTRLLEHRNLDAITCEGLLNAQLPMELKTQQADVVVWNDGSQAILEAQALTLLRDRWETVTSIHV